MQLKYTSANLKNYGRLAEDYYEESEKAHGIAIRPIRNVSLRRLTSSYRKKEGRSTEVLKRLDINYENALKNLDLAYDDFTSRIISLVNDNNYLIAHTTMVINQDPETGEFKPFITDIIIKNGDKLQDDPESNIHLKYGIYSKILEYYEHLACKIFPNVQRLDIHTYAKDGDLWSALRNAGYDINDSSDLDKRVIRFTKIVRKEERDISDGGNITLK